MFVDISINNVSHQVSAGLISGGEIYSLIEDDGSTLILCQSHEVDIPLDASTYIVIQGNEIFVTREQEIENNPLLRNTMSFVINGEDKFDLSQPKVTGKKIKSHDAKLPDGRLFVLCDSGSDVEITDDMQLLVQTQDSFIMIPTEDNSATGDAIDIELCSQHDRIPPKGQKLYRIRIDGNKFNVSGDRINGKEILQLVDKLPEEWALNQKFRDGRRERIGETDLVDISQRGVERFETVRKQAQQGHD